MAARVDEPVEIVPISSSHVQDPTSTPRVKTHDRGPSSRIAARSDRPGNRQTDLPKQDPSSDRSNAEAMMSCHVRKGADCRKDVEEAGSTLFPREWEKRFLETFDLLTCLATMRCNHSS